MINKHAFVFFYKWENKSQELWTLEYKKNILPYENDSKKG